MNKHRFGVLVLAATMTLFSATAQASYTYAYQRGEYSITLPGPPHGETIWGSGSYTPLLGDSKISGRVGEIARFKRSTVNTGDSLDVEIITVSAETGYLQSLDEDKLVSILEKDGKASRFSQKEVFFSQSEKDPFRKAVKMTGYNETKEGVPIYNHLQLMTGESSITLVKINYSAENLDFKKDVYAIVASIKFVGN
ncbi:MAG: hypothetical protein AB7H77_11535 [Bdellovibrionales bacterium]